MKTPREEFLLVVTGSLERGMTCIQQHLNGKMPLEELRDALEYVAKDVREECERLKETKSC